jgi:hypothetical protein
MNSNNTTNQGTTMKVWKKVIWTSMSIAGLGALGCNLSVHNHPQDPQAEAQPQAQPQVGVEQQPQDVVVQEAPPALIVESQPAPPSPDYVWVGGYWNWDNQKYSWQAGRYSRPPAVGVAWVAPRYDAGAHRYTPGRWSK